MALLRCLAGLSLGLAAIPAGAQQAQADPGTGPNAVLSEWLEAFNTGGDAGMKAFYARRLDDPDALTARTLRTETCGFDLVRIEKQEAARLSALLAERCFPALQRVSFAVAEDGTLDDFALEPFAMSGARLDAYVTGLADRLAERDEFAGSLVVLTDDGRRLEASRGMVSAADQTPIGPDTPMFLASAGKMFTAVAILQLVKAGRVELDAPLSRYLPDYPNEAMAGATIRQLLSHRAGAGEDGVLRREDTGARARVRTIDDYLALNGDRPPDFEPGTKSDYSNYGFILLGAVIERVTGETYPDYVRAHVFEPAGMTEAGYPDRENLGGIPVGLTTFFEAEPALVPNTEVLPWRGSAHGGGVASANDMLRFFAALKGGTLLPPESLELATTPGETPWYGLGFVAQGGEHPQWGHGGGSYGMSVAAQTYPSKGATFVCLAARDMACDRLIFAWYLKLFGLTE